MSTKSIISTNRITSRIYLMREQKVMLDSDLAELYEESTGRLNEQVRRNKERFPEEFAFQLTQDEYAFLMSQNAISKSGHGGRRKLPWAFTEHGILMLSSVLRSKRAIQVNIEIMRAFVEMRKILLSYSELSYRIDKLEEGYDTQFKIVFDAIRKLMTSDKPSENGRPLGFRLNEEETGE